MLCFIVRRAANGVPQACGVFFYIPDKAFAVGERRDEERKHRNEQIQGDKVPQERRERFARRKISHKDIGGEKADHGDQPFELRGGMEEPAGVCGVQHLPKVALRALCGEYDDIVEADEDERGKEEEGDLPKITPFEFMQPQQRNKERARREQLSRHELVRKSDFSNE